MQQIIKQMEVIMKQITFTLLASFALLTTQLSYSEVSDEINNAVASSERLKSDASRDASRKPAEILSLLGIKSGMNVIDLSSGGGYYTDIISRVVGKDGKVYSHNTPYVINRFADSLNNPDEGWLLRLKSQQWKSNVTKMVGELDGMSYPIQLDVAMMVLFYHDIIWQGVDTKVMNRHIFNALKPGGAFMIIDHNAKSGTGVSDVESLHRIDKQYIIDELTSAGFKLEVDSDLLAIADDTRDFPFSNNPSKKRDHTDRMVLKFVKPVK